MASVQILSDEFAEAAALAGLHARQRALSSGHAVIFVDAVGRYVKELPDGTQFEVRLKPSISRESHVEVIREIAAQFA